MSTGALKVPQEIVPCTGGRGPCPLPPCSSERHPRRDGVGVGLSDARLHPGLFQKREQRAQAFACVCQLFLPSGEPAVEVGFLGPRAQSLPLPRAVPRHCPAQPAQSELCPRLGPAPRPPTFQQGPQEARTDRAFRTHACWGDELLPRIICHEHRVAFHVPKVGRPWRLGSRALIPTVQGQKLYSIPQQQASAPHHLGSTPQRTPHPHPGPEPPFCMA